MIQDLSAMADGSLSRMGSMSGSNIVSAKPQFQPEGSPSEAVLDSDVRPEPAAVPATQAGAHLAGPGDKGGVLAGKPGGEADGSWTQANDAATGDGSGRWTTARRPFDPDDI